MNKDYSNIVIYLTDKETGKESKPVDIEDIIFRQNEIEFEFGDYLEDDDYGSLPYDDFLFFRGDYDVHIKVVK